MGYVCSRNKKRIKPHGGGGTGGGKFRDLYAEMFKNRGILPDALARQKPRILFAMLDSLNVDSGIASNADSMTEYQRMFYGL